MVFTKVGIFGIIRFRRPIKRVIRKRWGFKPTFIARFLCWFCDGVITLFEGLVYDERNLVTLHQNHGSMIDHVFHLDSKMSTSLYF